MTKKKQRKKGRPTKRPSLEEFNLLYYNPSITIYELAEHWKVKPQTVYNWATYFSKSENANYSQKTCFTNK